MMIKLFSIFTIATLGFVALYIPHKLKVSDLDPISNPLPELPVFPVDKQVNITGKVEIIGQNELVGPETIVQGDKYLFAALGDGRIARIQQESWEFILEKPDPNCGFSPWDEGESEDRCGRPLGMLLAKRSTVDPNFVLLEESPDDEDVLLVADAYKGIYLLTNIYQSTSEIRVVHLAAHANNDQTPFRLLNAVVQAPDGSIYISETSRVFQRRRIFWAVMDGHSTGRLMRYTPQSGVEVVVENLYMPNGLALSHDGTEILIVAGVQILRYSLTEKKLLQDQFVSVMPGTGDNINAMDHLPTGETKKCYWAGLGSKFAQPFSLLKLVSEKPLLKSVLLALVPYKVIVNFIPKLSALAVYDESGELIQVYKDDRAVAPWISEGESFDGYLYLGSWFNPFLARVRMSDEARTS